MTHANRLPQLESQRFETRRASDPELVRTELIGAVVLQTAVLRREIAELRLEVFKWMFGSFYFATMLGLVALMVALT